MQTSFVWALVISGAVSASTFGFFEDASLKFDNVEQPATTAVCADISESPEDGYCQTWLGRFESVAKKTRKEGGRWFLSEYDFDNRGFNVLHFMGHSPLPFGFSVWGFIDIEGADILGADREDLATYFLEIDLKRNLWQRGGIVAELNDLQGEDNAIGRFGFFWNPEHLESNPKCGWFAGKQRIGFKIFPLETDNRGWQASLNWNKQFDQIFDGRLSAGGFVDLNFDAARTSNDLVLVSEHQIRLRLVEGLHLITEFRINEFLPDDFGIAPGIQYRY